MNNLQPSTFTIPVITLLLVIFLYLLLLKKASNQSAFKHFTIATIVVSFLLNFIWEMLQMPLYNDMELNWQTTLYCALASVADVLMVLLIYYGFALIYKDPFWVQNLTIQRTIILVLIGGIGAILAEMRHLSLGNWSYSEAMPLIPVVNAGLSPVLQFMILPAVSYYISYYYLSRRHRRGFHFSKT